MTYNIGGHNIKVNMYCGDEALNRLLPSFVPFKTNTKEGEKYLFILDVCEILEPKCNTECCMIKDVDTGNGITHVAKLENGGYQFKIYNVDEQLCALLICSKAFKKCQCKIIGSTSMARFALNNALMLVFAFSSAKQETLLLHASVVRHNDVAYAFTAKSGTGKSTQVANWIQNIEGCDIINDDNPIIRIIGNDAILYGSPWSGKTPCYRNQSVRLGALLQIKRDNHNYVTPQLPIIAFSTLLTGCSAMKWDEVLFQNVCSTASKVVERIKVAELHCLPDAQSAFVCKEYLEA